MPPEAVRRAIRYAIVCYAVSWSAGAVVLCTGGVQASPLNWLLYVNSWVPAAVATTLRLRSREGFRSAGWGLRRPMYLVLAGAPLLVHGLAVGLVAAGSRVRVAAGAGTGRIVSYMAVDVLVNCALVFGEEFGWRGYMQDRVLAALGDARGLLVMSVVWSFWHLPYDLTGMAFPTTNALLGAFVLRPIAFVGLGTLVGLTYQRTRSVWAACLVHAVNNVAGAQTRLFIEPATTPATVFLATLAAVYFCVGAAALALVCRRAAAPDPATTGG